MLIRIKSFLLFQVVYHLLVVGISYGGAWISQSYLAILRDGLWILLVGIFLFLYRKKLWSALSKRSKEFLIFGGVVLFALGMSRFYAGAGLSQILIGFKYGLWYWGIFLMAGLLWYLGIQSVKKSDFSSFLSCFSTFLKWSLPIIVLVGWIRQVAKLVFPDFFHGFGYGGLDDFHYGSNPPIYYLTGFEGTLRRQGLFAGPNNYGYFLVAFLPVIMWLFPLKFQNIKKRKKADWRSFLVQLFRLLSIAATLSRAALVGVFVVLILHYRKLFWKFKEFLFGATFGIVALLWALSFWKWDSTLVHVQKKLEWFYQVWEAPLWYGLGSSWPAVHHQGKFLPENYYVQLLLDIWVFWFGMRLLMLIFSAREQRRVLAHLQIASWEKQPQKNRNTVVNTSYSNVCFAVMNTSYSKSDFYFLLSAFQEGFFALLVMGLFLHVFEDSMVNYRFFVSYGLVFGASKFLAFEEKRDAS